MNTSYRRHQCICTDWKKASTVPQWIGAIHCMLMLVALEHGRPIFCRYCPKSREHHFLFFVTWQKCGAKWVLL